MTFRPRWRRRSGRFPTSSASSRLLALTPRHFVGWWRADARTLGLDEDTARDDRGGRLGRGSLPVLNAGPRRRVAAANEGPDPRGPPALELPLRGTRSARPHDARLRRQGHADAPPVRAGGPGRAPRGWLQR